MPSGSTPTSKTSPAPITLTVASPSIRSGASTTLTATQAGNVVKGGTWQVVGDASNGTIDSNGLYQAPTPAPEAGTVGIEFSYQGLTASATLSVLNPLPIVTSFAPLQVPQGVTTTLTLAGTGFIPGSSVLQNGTSIAATYLDNTHLSVVVTPASVSTTTLSLQVLNPAPGAATSNTVSLPVLVPAILVTPAALPTGMLTFSITRAAGFPGGTVVQVNGVPFLTKPTSPISVNVSGFLPPWQTNDVGVAVVGSDSSILDSTTVPIAPTAVSYDAAARFAQQAAFGPRHDVIERIQTLGFARFLDEQMQEPIASYPAPTAPRQSYFYDIAAGNSLLRQRMASAFQSYIPEEEAFIQPTGQPWETTLEADAFGSYKQILLDAANTVAVANPLGLTGNVAPTDPALHPNQNFARELMQLFSMGSVALNDDGTVQTDSAGNPTPSYSEDTVLNLSRALTGWEFAPAQNAYFTYSGVDWSAGYVAVESEHDHGAKTLFGVTLPAGQNAAQDRAQAMDIIFRQPSVAPFVSRLLIQHLVTSQPSAAYLSRVAQVFKDDGTGVRGNLGAVIRAILLDPEARAGDTGQGTTNGGIVQDPMSMFTSAISLLELTGMDTQPTYQPGILGEDFWQPGSVFSSFSPSYVIPGTTINSPEFQLINTMTIVQRSEALYGVVQGGWAGFNANTNTWIYQHFNTVASMTDAMNHMLYHGQMPQYEKDILSRYCSAQANAASQVRCVVFLALNGDSYTVVH